jgi:hypothetical protein
MRVFTYAAALQLRYEGVAAPVLAAPWVPRLTEEKSAAPIGDRDCPEMGMGSLSRALHLPASLGLLVLAERPLVALDLQSAVFADRDGTGAMPLRWAFTHQFSP